ncbi:unnamed protein product [Caenorhabditis bovis]|uniref:Cadherin domain-containing protein n=1 Tax=Caenorhabditis bovis TaxID=2654633 RepID=A0A8S1ER33_9PELO|nr:unnamed protein product [Caenorhabditis bovis]
MREISMLSIFIALIIAADGREVPEENLLHSFKHVYKRHDINLDFTLNSEEHKDIRRSTSHDQLSQHLVNDKFVVRRDEFSESREVVGDAENIPDKFDQQLYDFMLPEGSVEKPAMMAVVDFITKKNGPPPMFAVNFDENGWFDIGKVKKTQAANADVYKATVVLKPGKEVSIDKTNEGIYKFVVEAQQGDIVRASTNIRVEVLSLSPTTKRIRITPPKAPIMLTTPAMQSSTTTSEQIEETTTIAEIREATTTTTDELKTSSKFDLPEHGSGLEGSAAENSEEEEEEVVEESSGDMTVAHASTHSSHDSTELLTNSAEADDNVESPIEGPVTILPLKAGSIDSSEEASDLSINLVGAENDGTYKNRDASLVGDLLRGLVIQLKSESSDIPYVRLSVEPDDVFTIRPSNVTSDGLAAVYVKNPKMLEKSVDVEIVATLPTGVSHRRPLIVKTSKKLKVEPKSKHLILETLEFGVAKNAENGRTIGRIEGNMQIIGEHEKFSLVGNDLILSCGQFETDHCLENEDRKKFVLMMMPEDGSLAPVQVIVRVQRPPSLRTSDNIVRISDNRIISPFAVITEGTLKDIQLEGDAARFLGYRKSEDGLYQLVVIDSAAAGKHKLEISLEGFESIRQIVNVLVENSLSHAHFRQPKYVVKIDAGKIKHGDTIAQVELEGVPIDEATILAVDGNPGWVIVEDYGGKVRVGKGKLYNGKSTLRVAAVDKTTSTVLTETMVEINVENGEAKNENEKMTSVVRELIFDREKDAQFVAKMENVKDFAIDPEALFGIDEHGKKIKYSPMNVKLSKETVEFEGDSLKELRLISCTLKNQYRKETILIRLISSPEFIEKMKMEAARPVFPAPWTRENNEIKLEINEELPEGSIIAVLPATVPTTNEVVPAVLDGEMMEAFNFDPKTGELKINKRIDYETLSDSQRSFKLNLISGEPEFESNAIININVNDIDDNPPTILPSPVETLTLPENLTPGSIIARLDVNDPDGSDKFDVKLSGRGMKHYNANISDSGILSIMLSDDANLDRELENSHSLIVDVTDVSGNTERLLVPIEIMDVNDNSPIFETSSYNVEVVEDWPKNVIIEKIFAKDLDEGNSGIVRYSMDGENSQAFAINSSTGVVSIADDLFGLARKELYHLSVTAFDLGRPSMNSTANLNVRILSSNEILLEPVIEFSEPAENFILSLKENTPLNEKVYTAKAEIRGIGQKGNKVEYDLKDLTLSDDEQVLKIDKNSGEVFVSKPIDFEEKNAFTLYY